jgi:hypothetical protein
MSDGWITELTLCIMRCAALICQSGVDKARFHAANGLDALIPIAVNANEDGSAITMRTNIESQTVSSK